jgi:hypothetical protein
MMRARLTGSCISTSTLETAISLTTGPGYRNDLTASQTHADRSFRAFPSGAATGVVRTRVCTWLVVTITDWD